MRTNPNLLPRGAADPLSRHHALASLLSVAAAPASDRELAGEDDAVLAFRYAQLGPAPRRRRPSMSLTKLLAAKAALAAVGLTGGGFALAAATGHLPSTAGKPAAASSAANAAASRSANSHNSGNHPSASPSPSLRGLCQAYTSHAADNPGKALSNPAFTALINAAGGKSNVAGFCATKLAVKPGNTATHPAGKPTAVPSNSHAAGKPTAHPSGKPTEHP